MGITTMWIKTRNDRLINLDHVREISTAERYLTVTYASDGKREVIHGYDDEYLARKAIEDIETLIVEAHSIPFADNSVVFEI